MAEETQDYISGNLSRGAYIERIRELEPKVFDEETSGQRVAGEGQQQARQQYQKSDSRPTGQDNSQPGYVRDELPEDIQRRKDRQGKR